MAKFDYLFFISYVTFYLFKILTTFFLCLQLNLPDHKPFNILYYDKPFDIWYYDVKLNIITFVLKETGKILKNVQERKFFCYCSLEPYYFGRMGIYKFREEIWKPLPNDIKCNRDGSFHSDWNLVGICLSLHNGFVVA